MASKFTVIDENDPIAEESLLFTPRFNLERTPPPEGPSTPLSRLKLTPLRTVNTTNKKQKAAATSRSASYTIPLSTPAGSKTPRQRHDGSPFRSISNDSIPASTIKSRIPISTPSRHTPVTTASTPSQTHVKTTKILTRVKAATNTQLNTPTPSSKRSGSGTTKPSNQKHDSTIPKAGGKAALSTINIISSLPQKTPIRSAGTQVSSGGKSGVSIGPSRIFRHLPELDYSKNEFNMTPAQSIPGTFQNKSARNTSDDENIPRGQVPRMLIEKKTTSMVDGSTSPMKMVIPKDDSATNKSLMEAVIGGSAKTTFSITETSRLPIPKTPERTPQNAKVPLSRRKLPTIDLTSPITQTPHPALVKLLDGSVNGFDIAESPANIATMMPPPPQPLFNWPSDAKTPVDKVKATETEEKKGYTGSPLIGSPSRGRGRHKKASEIVRGIWTGKTQVLETGVSFDKRDKVKIKELANTLREQIITKKNTQKEKQVLEAELVEKLDRLRDDMKAGENDILALMNAVALCDHCI